MNKQSEIESRDEAVPEMLLDLSGYDACSLAALSESDQVSAGAARSNALWLRHLVDTGLVPAYYFSDQDQAKTFPEGALYTIYRAIQAGKGKACFNHTLNKIQLAVLSGDVAYFEELLVEPLEYRYAIKLDLDGQCLVLYAIYSQSPAMVKRIAACYPDEEIPHALLGEKAYAIYREAARLGNLDVFQVVASIYEKEDELPEVFEENNYPILQAAARSGNANIFKEMTRYFPESKDLITALVANNHGVLRNAARSGQLKMFEEVKKHYPNEKVLQAVLVAWNQRILRAVAASGNIELFNALVAKCYPNKETLLLELSTDNHALLACAVSSGNVELLNALTVFVVGEIPQKALKADEHRIIWFAILSERLEMFEVIAGHYHNTKRMRLALEAADHRVLHSAAGTGNFGLFNAVFSFYSGKMLSSLAVEHNNHSLLRTAAASGNVKIFNAIVGCYANEALQAALALEDHRLLREIAELGHIEIFYALIKLYPRSRQTEVLAEIVFITSNIETRVLAFFCEFLVHRDLIEAHHFLNLRHPKTEESVFEIIKDELTVPYQRIFEAIAARMPGKEESLKDYY